MRVEVSTGEAKQKERRSLRYEGIVGLLCLLWKACPWVACYRQEERIHLWFTPRFKLPPAEHTSQLVQHVPPDWYYRCWWFYDQERGTTF